MSNEKEQLSYDQIISLLSIYENEYEHRDIMLWTHIFRFFYISILIMVIPNVSERLSINLPPVSPRVFPIIGMLISTISYLLSLSYQKRLEASSESFRKINNLLPEKYQRVKIDELKHGKYFKGRQAIIIPVIIYIISLIIGFTLLLIR